MLTRKEKDQMIEKIYAFHTKRAPGIAIGVAMVDLALDKLGEVKDKINAVCEGQSCLVDVIQVMTGCTYGNKYLRVAKELGRFAFTLFDRFDGRGVRVFIEFNKINPEQTPELARFFTRTRSKEVKQGGAPRAESARIIVKEFENYGNDIIGWGNVWVKDFAKPPMYPAAICPICNESFLIFNDSQTTCPDCDTDSHYFKKS